MVVGRRGYVRVRPIMWLAVIAYMIDFTHQLRFRYKAASSHR